MSSPHTHTHTPGRQEARIMEAPQTTQLNPGGAAQPRAPGLREHRGPLPHPRPRPVLAPVYLRTGRGRGPTWVSRPWGAPGRGRGPPGAPRLVPLLGQGPRGAPGPALPQPILAAPGTPARHSRRPPDRGRLRDPLCPAAPGSVPYAPPLPAASASRAAGVSPEGRGARSPAPAGEAGPAHRPRPV